MVIRKYILNYLDINKLFKLPFSISDLFNGCLLITPLEEVD